MSTEPGIVGALLQDVAGGPDLVGRIDALLQRIAVRMERPEPLTQEVQQCLGQLSTVLPYLPRLKNAEINVAQAELAVRALLSPRPEADLAKAIVNDLLRRKRVYDSAFRSIVYGRTPATFVLLGVLTHAVVLAPVLFGLSRLFPLAASGAAASVWWVPLAIAGAVGGATSLLARLNTLAGLSRWSSEGDPLQLFYTGLLKPVVGIVAGLFAYAAFSSGLITVHVPGASPDVFYAALAFLAGFSERFARDLTDSASKLIGEE